MPATNDSQVRKAPFIYSVDNYTAIQRGLVPGVSIVHKFGWSGTIPTTYKPITPDLVYQTPAAAVALEFLSGSGDDDVGGTGATEVTLVGLDSDWLEQTVTVATNGTTVVTTDTDGNALSFTRLYRWFVSKSGTYASAAAGSHAGVLTLRVAGAGATWSTIGVSDFPLAQSLIGVYTVPKNKTAYLLSQHIQVDSTKAADVIFFSRANADDVATPYTGVMRIVNQFVGVTESINPHTISPGGGDAGPCDVGFMAKVTSGTGVLSVDFEILLVDD